MKKTILVVMFVSLVVAACGKNNESGKSPAPSTSGSNPVFTSPTGENYDLEKASSELLSRVNDRRISWSLRPFERDLNLDAQAQAFAQDLADGREFRHHERSRICATIRARDCAELTVLNEPNPRAVVNSWMSRESAKDILAYAPAQRAGVGIAVDRNNRPVWVLVMLPL